MGMRMRMGMGNPKLVDLLIYLLIIFWKFWNFHWKIDFQRLSEERELPVGRFLEDFWELEAKNYFNFLENGNGK